MNSLYDKGRQSFLEGSIAILTDTIKVALVTGAYTPNLATHQFLSSVTGRVGTDQVLGSKTSTSGVFAAANATFVAVAPGSTVTYILLYKDTGVAATSPLIALIDTATGLPVLTNGGDITISWDTGVNKILKL